MTEMRESGLEADDLIIDLPLSEEAKTLLRKRIRLALEDAWRQGFADCEMRRRSRSMMGLLGGPTT